MKKKQHSEIYEKYMLYVVNKSSAVAEMGDRARAKWAEKWGQGLLYPFPNFRRGGGCPSNTMCMLPRPIPITSGILILDPFSRLTTLEMHLKVGTAVQLCPFFGELGPHLTQCCLG